MGDGEGVNAVLSGEEEGQDTSALEQGTQADKIAQSASTVQAQPQAPATATPSASTAPSGVQLDTSQKVHPHVAILAGLVNKIIGNIQNASGNPNNAFDRGFMQASPQAQQQKQQAQQKALTEQQQADVNLAMSRLQYQKAMDQAANLDPATQQKTIDAAFKQGEQDRANGSILAEIGVDGEGYGAAVTAQKQVFDKNKQEIDSGSRDRWEMIASNNDPKHATFSIVKKNMDGVVKKSVPKITKDDSGNETWDGETYEDRQGTQSGLDAISAHGISLYTKSATKDFVKEFHATLGNQKAPETQDDADQRMSQLQAYINLVGKTDPVYTKLAQDEMANIKKNYGSLPKNQAALKKAERDPNAGTGTWTLQEDTHGKPVLLNSKTGEIKPAGDVEKTGTFAKSQAGADAANYAENYLASGNFTGSGDEALLEKFFELAKPSSGFRMNQATLNMLRDSRSWIESAKAKADYVAGGKLFSDTQRKQIVDTMKLLLQSKGGGKPSSGGFTKYSSDGKWGWNGKEWVAVQGK